MSCSLKCLPDAFDSGMSDCPLGFAAVQYKGKVHAMPTHLLSGKINEFSLWKCYLLISAEARDGLTEDDSRGD